jgi:23S rRNA (cytosine1962-C5)-methyltransferase
VDILNGQKTGFFLDQRENRGTIARFSSGATVLDCFCNQGGFALNAARNGAVDVLGLDSSEDAIRSARHNAALNNLSTVSFEQSDVFEKLKLLLSQEKRFDVIVLDPPSFTKTRKNVQTAKKGYKELHTDALHLLKEGGILLSASCSHHILPDVFLEIIATCAIKSGRHLQMLDWRGSAPDHPTLPLVPETRYLKFGAFRLT